MEGNDLGKRYLEEKEYQKKVVAHFWNDLSDEQKNEFISRGKIDKEQLKSFFNKHNISIQELRKLLGYK